MVTFPAPCVCSKCGPLDCNGVAIPKTLYVTLSAGVGNVCPDLTCTASALDAGSYEMRWTHSDSEATDPDTGLTCRAHYYKWTEANPFAGGELWTSSGCEDATGCTAEAPADPTLAVKVVREETCYRDEPQSCGRASWTNRFKFLSRVGLAVDLSLLCCCDGATVPNCTVIVAARFRAMQQIYDMGCEVVDLKGPVEGDCDPYADCPGYHAAVYVRTCWIDVQNCALPSLFNSPPCNFAADATVTLTGPTPDPFVAETSGLDYCGCTDAYHVTVTA